MRSRTELWDRLPDGREVLAHTIGDAALSVTVLDWGGRVHAVRVETSQDRRNVVLGQPDASTYPRSPGYLGATIGRYANRIARGRFCIDGVEHVVPANSNGHSLHGGPDGFDRQLWETASVGPTHAELRLVSPAGHQGFPGRVEATVRFEVTGNQIQLVFGAITDAPTPVALTQHTYFNLDGESSGSVATHLLRVDADMHTPTDGTGIPTGELAPVEGALDWRLPTRLGDRLGNAALREGLDHNFVLNGVGLRDGVWLTAGDRRLTLVVATDQPGVQIYSAGKFDGTIKGTSRAPYGRFAGVAIEPQPFPDSPNNPSFPDVILRPGQVLQSRTTWTFQVS